MNTDLDLISLIFVCKNVIVLSSFDIILGTLWLSLALLPFMRMYKTHFFTIFLYVSLAPSGSELTLEIIREKMSTNPQRR